MIMNLHHMRLPGGKFRLWQGSVVPIMLVLTACSGAPSPGALLTLLLFRIDLNLYSAVGLIKLIGIVKKNAIMMIDFAVEAEHSGQTPEEAIFEAAGAFPPDHADQLRSAVQHLSDRAVMTRIYLKA